MLGSLRCHRCPFWWAVCVGRIGVGIALGVGHLFDRYDEDFDSYDSLASP